MNADAGAAWRELSDAASRPYRRAGRFAWHYARGKLRLDPVFRHLIEAGLVAPAARVLDIGCGQGLLTSLLAACGPLAARGGWPTAWAPPPLASRVTGVDLDQRDLRRARTALGAAARFEHGDMRSTPFAAVDTLVLLDVLHYISGAEQDALLARAGAALPPGGRLLLRVGDAEARRGLRATQWLDRLGAVVRGLPVAPQALRSAAAWRERLEALGFEVSAVPMSRGTPFVNVLLVARALGGPAS